MRIDIRVVVLMFVLVSYTCFSCVAFLHYGLCCVHLQTNVEEREAKQVSNHVGIMCSSLWHLSSFPAATLPTQMGGGGSFCFWV